MCMCVPCLPTAVPLPQTPLHVSWVMTGGSCIVFFVCFFSLGLTKTLVAAVSLEIQIENSVFLKWKMRCSGFEMIPHTLDVLMPRTRVNLLEVCRSSVFIAEAGHEGWGLRTVTAGARGVPPNTCSLDRIENKSCVMEMSPSFSVWLIQCAATKEEDGRGGRRKNWDGWSKVEDWSLCRRCNTEEPVLIPLGCMYCHHSKTHEHKQASETWGKKRDYQLCKCFICAGYLSRETMTRYV